jgi:hypothetical protein
VSTANLLRKIAQSSANGSTAFCPPRQLIQLRGLADHGFERRYGLRFEDPLIRFRWLDPSRAPGGISDATIPLPQLADYAPACAHVIVTENKINFLTLPQRPDVLAIFGGGYAIDLLRALAWIANQPLHYWGDLDTHGFAILSRLRQYFPHTRSFLMGRDTLMMHRELWTEELSGTRVLRDLPNLDPHEQGNRPAWAAWAGECEVPMMG